MSAIVCVHQGAEESPDKENKDEPPKEPRSPGVALVQQGSKEKADGANAITGTTKQHGIRKNQWGKPIICFHCSKNHPVRECPDIPLEKREKIMMSKNKEWAKTKATLQKKRTAGKQQQEKQVDGQVHMQVTVNNIDGRPPH